MSAAKWRPETGVVQQLLDEPHRFQFFQAVRLLELWLIRNGVAHETALTSHVRFANSLSLAFPASEIEAIGGDNSSIAKTEAAYREALQRGVLKHVSLTPTFMGFLGSSGALPAHYTERIAAHRAFARDAAPQEFLNTFSNRAVALFYEAWRKYRLEFKYELGRHDGFMPLLLSLAGFGHKALHQRAQDDGDDIRNESIAHFAGALRHRPVSAAYMTQVLREYFRVPVAVEQFVGAWYEMPRNQQTRIGVTNALLGSTAMAGERVWQRDLRMRLKIGPLTRRQFDRFLPGANSMKVLKKLLTLFTNVSLEYEVQLILRAADVTGITLAGQQAVARLGWDTFLATTEQTADRGDVRYALHDL